ncbi:MAG: hypothetical protein IJV27_08640 [Prevotella sp.]|nr:hypothetical protein [Prevotella sp.]
MNEETIISKNTNVAASQQVENKEKHAWKHVTLGGVSGILMGAGLVCAGSLYASEATTDIQQGDADEENADLQVANVDGNLSFGDAFAAARAEVGPGGVFYWHGGIYNTYTSEEWNGMTDEQKLDFAQQVRPEVQPETISIPTDVHPDIVMNQPDVPSAHEAAHDNMEDIAVVDETAQNVAQHIENNFSVGNDIHVIGYADAGGHLMVGYDMGADGQADIALIDMDDSGDISAPDILIDSEGNYTTVGEPSQPDPMMQASLDNPEVAPDMPDYMNDAVVDV